MYVFPLSREIYTWLYYEYVILGNSDEASRRSAISQTTLNACPMLCAQRKLHNAVVKPDLLSAMTMLF